MRILIITVLLSISSNALSATERAIFAGGCFWCVEADFDKVKGVVKTVSGFDGGTRKNPTYRQVSSGGTNYLEAVEVIFDPQQVSYGELVKYFMRHIDPTDSGGQFCDRGNSYRSAIFYLNKEQKKTAERILLDLKKSINPIVTSIKPSTHFYPAEGYHQNYYKKNPIRYKYYRWRCGRDQRVKEVWENVKM